MEGNQHPIEREFAYRPGWFAIIACGVFFAICAAVIADAALTNHRAIRLFRIVTLAPGDATVFLWVLVALAAGFVVIAFALAWHRISFRQRLGLTAQGIVLPEGRWSRAERFIAYADMQRLQTVSVHGQHFLHIHHKGGKHTVTASMLPSKAAFEEVSGRIAAEFDLKTQQAAHNARPA